MISERRPSDFACLTWLSGIPDNYCDVTVAQKCDVARALKRIFAQHRHQKESRRLCELVVYATWMTMSKSIDSWEKRILLARIKAHMSDEVFDGLHASDIEHAAQVCRYVRHYNAPIPTVSGRKRMRPM